jgi:hypothetical protein
MAKKGTKMEATKEIGHVRAELPRKDHDRLRRAADARGLSISEYVRQAVLLAVMKDEAEGVSKRSGSPTPGPTVPMGS